MNGPEWLSMTTYEPSGSGGCCGRRACETSLEMRQDFVGRHEQFDSLSSVKMSAQAAVILVPLRKACSRNSKLRPKMKE